MIAVGYVRRSQASRYARDGRERVVSLDEQRARIEAYCATQGWTLADVVTDDGVSGGKRARLDRLAAALAETGAARVVTYHLDRLARDTAALLDTVRTWTRRGVELHVVGRGRVAGSGSSDFIGVAIEGVVAEHFRLCVSEKTRDALARLRATGRRYTRILPYGYQATTDGRLVPEPAEAAVLDQLRARVAAGESYRAIARTLAAAGIVNRAGRPFRFRALARLVARAPIGL